MLEQSILTGTKKLLGLAEDYTVFDHDVCTYINTALSNLVQLGVIGPALMVHVEDKDMTWDDLIETLEFPNNELLGMIKNYVGLKARTFFDPAGTSFLIEAMDKQIAELEWRMNHAREMNMPYLHEPHWETIVVEEVSW